MERTLIDAVFQLKSSKQEAKADATTRVAREIIGGEASARKAKTERLRAARLAREATAKPVGATAKKVRRKG
jgi:hypothetical protein